ncbi:MAG: hypothetical protein MdMp014T_3010 [Treponematales bacterium]
MGWYESKVYESAWPQVDATVEAILKDPYLMPPCPVFGRVFESLAIGEIDSAKFSVRDMVRAIVKSLHNATMNLGAGDYEINLLDFWRYLFSCLAKPEREELAGAFTALLEGGRKT